MCRNGTTRADVAMIPMPSDASADIAVDSAYQSLSTSTQAADEASRHYSRLYPQQSSAPAASRVGPVDSEYIDTSYRQPGMYESLQNNDGSRPTYETISPNTQR